MEHGNGPECVGKICHSHSPFHLITISPYCPLPGRSNNIANLKFTDLGVFRDALTIVFDLTKGNQTGEDVQPKLAYANPHNWFANPFLAMEVYLATNQGLVARASNGVMDT